MKKAATIVVVDDNLELREGICDLLQVANIGFDINTLQAIDGRSGLAIMSQHTPDLIISDIMMPNMDGFEFVQQVRKNIEWVELPFIFLTARGSEEDELKGRLSGADLYLTKPIDIELLLGFVESQLKRSLQIQAKRQKEKTNLQKTILHLLNHEFRTPLTYVSAYSEMLEDGLQSQIDPQEFHAYLQGIQAGCMRLTRLVESFIQIIELRTGDAQLDFNRHAKPIENLTPLIKAALQASLQFTHSKDIHIHLDIPDQTASIYGDSIRLITIFKEILDNAIKFALIYNGESAQVNITYASHENFQTFSFEDNGIGISSEVHERIFDLFYQHDREFNEQQGAGIGLCIAQGLVDLHGGRIEVESQSGLGSKFAVKLPIIHPNRSPTEVSPYNGRIPAKILVVEDDFNLLTGLSDLLQMVNSKYQFEVFTAQNGAKGLTILEDHTPHLILTDILMPIMDGYSFLEEIRQNPKWIEIPIIFLTALKEVKDQHRGWRSGIAEYITKPYRADILVGLIEKQLDRYFKVQGILKEDFDILKRNILNLLPKNMQSPLTSVRYHSTELVGTLSAAQTEDALKTALQAIRQSNIGLTNHIEDFIALAEQQTDEADNNYQLYARPINRIAELIQQIQHCLTPQQTQSVSLFFQLEDDLPAIFGLENVIYNSLTRILNVCLQCHPHAAFKDIAIQAQIVAEELFIIFNMHTILAAEETLRIHNILAKIDPTTLQSAPYAAALRITLGNINLHNGRFFFNNHPQAQFTVALPIYTPPADQLP